MLAFSRTCWLSLCLPLLQTEECIDSFDFEMAGRFCQRALELEPNNKQTLDMLGHIYSELGDAQRAKGISFTEENCV